MFEIDKKEFGSFLAELRKEKGLTQKKLAEKLFVSDKAVSKWETGGSIHWFQCGNRCGSAGKHFYSDLLCSKEI